MKSGQHKEFYYSLFFLCIYLFIFTTDGEVGEGISVSENVTIVQNEEQESFSASCISFSV